tara:strand:+ start:2951 stop:3199 length:249 start_codon:yes stop_codon:yes gene_type:complete
MLAMGILCLMLGIRIKADLKSTVHSLEHPLDDRQDLPRTTVYHHSLKHLTVATQDPTAEQPNNSVYNQMLILKADQCHLQTP